jgi:glucokinase
VVVYGRRRGGAGGCGGVGGHTPINCAGPRWFGGARGCGAAYASGRGIAEAARARVAGQPDAPLLRAAGGDPAAITAPLVFDVAAHGDPVAQAIVDDAYQALGAVVAMVVNGLNPEIVVITGGVMASLAAGEARILRAAGEYALAEALARTRVTIVPGDKRVTMRGAAALVLYELGTKEGAR